MAVFHGLGPLEQSRGFLLHTGLAPESQTAPWLTRLTLDKTPITRHERNISIKATRLELPALQFALQVPNVTSPTLPTERSLPERVMHDRILVVWH